MSRPIVVDLELNLSELLKQAALTDEQSDKMGHILTAIFTAYFSSLDRETGMKGWSIDDMYPDQVHWAENKLTLSGSVFWLSGGGECKYYQADIATDTTPVLYSVKFKNHRKSQVLYVGRTFDGWILNAI